MILTLLSKSLVSGLVHQAVNLGLVGDLDLGQPAIALGTLVDGAGAVLEHAVGLDNGSRDGRHDVRGRLYGFDGADAVAGADFEVDGGQFYKDDVTESMGCVGGDTYGAYLFCFHFRLVPVLEEGGWRCRRGGHVGSRLGMA